MRGDSFAEEPNTPEAQETQQSNSPQQAVVKDSTTAPVKENLKFSSLPGAVVVELNSQEAQENLQTPSSLVVMEESDTPGRMLPVGDAEDKENNEGSSLQATNNDLTRPLAVMAESITSETGENSQATSVPSATIPETDTQKLTGNLEFKSPEKSHSSTSLPSPLTPNSSENSRLRIFITGASGCVGHYLCEILIKETDYELFLLVRDPAKLQFDTNARPGINVIRGDMRDIPRHAKLLKTINCAILIATSWGGPQLQVLDVNIYKNIQLLSMLDPKVCQHIIYFSTASVLDRNNQILKQASQLGTDYIRSKSDFLTQVSRLPISKQMTVLFPTLVLGGDENHPYSHLSSGLPGVTKWIKLIRFFKADASFHFIHAKDIARVVHYLVDHPPATKEMRQFVLGNPAWTVNQAVAEACAYLDEKIGFRISLSPWLADLFIFLFRIEMSPWDRFCVTYRHFTYQDPINPATFGLPVYCANISDVLKLSGVPGRGGKIQQASSYRLHLDEPETEIENEI